MAQLASVNLNTLQEKLFEADASLADAANAKTLVKRMLAGVVDALNQAVR